MLKLALLFTLLSSTAFAAPRGESYLSSCVYSRIGDQWYLNIATVGHQPLGDEPTRVVFTSGVRDDRFGYCAGADRTHSPQFFLDVSRGQGLVPPAESIDDPCRFEGQNVEREEFAQAWDHRTDHFFRGFSYEDLGTRNPDAYLLILATPRQMGGSELVTFCVETFEKEAGSLLIPSFVKIQ